MSEVRGWDNAAANNNGTPPDGFPESMNFNEVNNAARELMAAAARMQQQEHGAVSTTGTGGAYALVSPVTIGALSNGDSFTFTANHNSPSIGSTLDVNGLGPQALQLPDGTGIIQDLLVAGGIYQAVFDGGVFQLIAGPLGGVGSLIALQVEGATGTRSIARPAGTKKVFYILAGAGGGAGGQESTNGYGGGGGQSGAMVFGLVTGIGAGSSDAVIGVAGTNGVSGATPTSGSVGGDSTYEGSNAGGGDGGGAGSLGAAGIGGNVFGTFSLNGAHVGGGLLGSAGKVGAQFDFVAGTDGALRQNLATGAGGDGTFLARGRGGGGGGGGENIVPGNGFGLFLFYG